MTATKVTRWQVFKKILETQRDPKRIGDMPVYKSELTQARARPQIEAQLEPVRGYAPPIDLDHLRQLQAGAFGREYVRLEERFEQTVQQVRQELQIELAN